MKKLLFPILILLTLLWGSSLYASQKNNLDWITNYNEALQTAQKEQKNIYMFIAADECRFCDMFKEQTLSKKNVIHKMEQEFVLLYLSRDQHFIPAQFERFGAPRHYFLSPSGEIVFESFGFLEPHGFFLLLDEYDLYKED